MLLCRIRALRAPRQDPVLRRAFGGAGLSRAVIGAHDTNAQAAGGAEILRRGGIEVKFDVCHAAAAELAEPFYLARESGFCFIKINATLNGAVHGRIGSEKQRAFVHELRGVCDYVGVGGQTVHADRPNWMLQPNFGDKSSTNHRKE